jgi:AcrR family transcriptional regulator
MGAVARHLGPYSPMALYRYVHSKDGLVDLMLDAVAAEVDVPDRPSGDWRADLHTLATRPWQVVRRHLWFPRLAHSRPPAGPHMMRRTEFALAVLTAEGVPLTDAMTYTALVERHVLGSGLQEAEERRMHQRYGMDGMEQFLDAVAPVRQLADAGPYPHLAAWLAAPAGPDADGQFELGLTFLLDGIAARLPNRTAAADR